MKKKLTIETVLRKANIKGLFKVLRQSPILLFLTLLFINALSFGQTTVVTGSTATVTFPYQVSAYSWTPPAGVTSINVEAWGGGGGGGGATSNTSRAGGGGGGGSYVQHVSLPVSSSTTYTITVGAGGIAGTTGSSGSNGANGGNTSSTFGAITITAVGGIGGNGFTYGTNTSANTSGSTVAGFGGPAASSGNSSGASLSLSNYGGAGASGIGGTSSGGGGGAAGPSGPGGAASNSTPGIYGGVNSSPYGIGGSGVLGATGVAGNVPGGGASGGATTSTVTTSRAGGAGGAGQFVITYTVTSPTISLSSASLTGFVTGSDATSSVQTINVSAANLTANISITAPNNFEISTSPSSGFGTSLSIPFGSGTVAATAIYVRIKQGAATGLLSESVTFSSTGAPDQTLTCSGSVVTNYYYTGTGSLATLTNWGTATNGTGTNPTNFITDYQNFIIRNTAAVSTDAAWTVSGTGSKIILGNATLAAITLTVTSGFPITGTGTIDITAASSGNNEIVFGNATLPTLGTIDVSANLNYANGATVPVTSKACNTLKISNNTTVNLSADANCKFLIVDLGSSMTGGINVVILSTGGNAIINGLFTGARSTGLFTKDAAVVSPIRGSIFSADLTASISLGSSSTIINNRASSSSAQPITALSYGNLTIGAITPIITLGTLTGSTIINGTLSILGGSSVATGGFPLTVNSAFTLSENSTITLGSGSHNVSFAASQAASWTVAKTLTITGWTGTTGATGTAGKIFFGSTASGLTAQQLSQISFTGYGTGTLLLSTGELVPQNTLPVSLTSFTGKKQNTGILLNWSTASESNNQRFDILRSGADKNFQKIGEVVGNVNSSTANYYSFIDKNPFSGVNYYTLKQVDFDGKSQEYGPIAVTSDLNNHSLEIYSNSNQSEITVFVSSTTANPIEINVYDLSGRSMLKQTVSLQSGFNKLSLEASKLSKGVFLLKITSDEGTLVKKFIY